MTIEELKQSAFAQRLRQFSFSDAVSYLGWCLYEGPEDSMVWDLFAFVGGQIDPENPWPTLEAMAKLIREAA